jgi:large subunit ribosomal protein L23
MNPYVLIKPVITEKSIAMAKDNNIYTFYVEPQADKRAIREAIETTFGVTVSDLKTVSLPSISKRTGRRRQRTMVAERKKAMALLPKGQKITLFDL